MDGNTVTLEKGFYDVVNLSGNYTDKNNFNVSCALDVIARARRRCFGVVLAPRRNDYLLAERAKARNLCVMRINGNISTWHWSDKLPDSGNQDKPAGVATDGMTVKSRLIIVFRYLPYTPSIHIRTYKSYPLYLLPKI